MIIRIEQNGYVLVKSDSGKRIRLVHEEQTYSEATDLIDKPREWVETE